MMLVLTSAVVLAAAGPSGIRPRGDAADYSAHESIDVAAFGAAVIPSAEVKKIFAGDLDHAGYIVIEVGVFPARRREVDLSALDFTLLTDPNVISERTGDVDAIAAAVIKPPKDSNPAVPSREVSVTTGASVEHVSYPEPVTGKKTGATIVGAGAGVGPPSGQQPFPRQGSADADRDRLARQLWQDLLPDGKTTLPVAGYLYFPKPAKKARNSTWMLQWENAAGRVKINMPPSLR